MDNLAKTKYKDGLKILQKAFNTGDYTLMAESVELFEAAININNEYTEAYFCLAYICNLLDKKMSAESLIRKVLELEPFNLKAQKMLKDLLENENHGQNEKLIRQEDFLNNIMKFTDEQNK